MKDRICVIDYETKGIERRPQYPPIPVGVGIWEQGRTPEYLSWGHPQGNTCTKAQARRRLLDVQKSSVLLMHNAVFDVDVARVHLDIPYPSVDLFRDTLIEGFLCYPDSKNLSLKPMAEQYAGIPPTERDDLRDWVLKHVPEATPKTWGGYICLAPAKLAGRYCKADLKMTKALHKHFAKDVVGMAEAYRRERTIALDMLETSGPGIPIRRRALAKDVARWRDNLDRIDDAMRKRLSAPDLDLNKPQQFADALEDVGFVKEWIMTAPSKTYPEGQRSVSKDNLPQVILDDITRDMWRYRNKLKTSISNFGDTWLEQSKDTDQIYCSWNTVRGERGETGKQTGARTGRMSSTPNVQNIPKTPSPAVYTKKDLKRFEELEPLQLVRSLSQFDMALPDLRQFIGGNNWWIVCRDYDQQELRILAHYEDGPMLAAYQENPKLDQHARARTLINNMLGTQFARTPIKTTSFGIIYGQGLGSLAIKLNESFDTCKLLRGTYKKINPGVKELEDDLRRRAKAGDPFYTWGGRRYYCEEPKWFGNKKQTYEYKMLNTIIQGSAADCTKEALIRYCAEARRLGLPLPWLQVHDEIVVGARDMPTAKEANRVLQECMESVEFDLPMLTSGGVTRKWSKS